MDTFSSLPLLDVDTVAINSDTVIWVLLVVLLVVVIVYFARRV